MKYPDPPIIDCDVRCCKPPDALARCLSNAHHDRAITSIRDAEAPRSILER